MGRIFAQRKFEIRSDERIVFVEHALQIQPLGRADGAAGGAVAYGEGFCDVFRRPGACADPFERADDGAHLVVQKRARTQEEVEFHSCGHGVLADAKFVQCFHRAFGLTDCRAEGCEIMFADERVCPLLHGRKIQSVFHLPDGAFFMHGRGAAHQKAEEVAPFKG